jgi:hypothetical protein
MVLNKSTSQQYEPVVLFSEENLDLTKQVVDAMDKRGEETKK